MADEAPAPEAQPAPAPKINFIYNSCNDLAAMREFYSSLLGMQETSYREGDQGWLVYDCGGLQFMIFPSSYELPELEAWGMQPGWQGGSLEVPSWSVEVSEADFAATVERLAEAGVPCFSDVPLWCQDSYWSFPVRDPMGNTVEVYTQPAERPASTDWPAG